MTKWEYEDYKWNDTYKCISMDGGGFTVKKTLDEMGQEGWELVAIYNGVAYFKRAINQEKLMLSDEFNVAAEEALKRVISRHSNKPYTTEIDEELGW